jgi:predicted nucleic acid-binding protein
MVSSGTLTLALDARILSEYTEVLARPKFKFDKEHIAILLDHIDHCGIIIASVPLPQSLPDRDDEPFLEVAIAAKASCLVTGNRIHFPTELCKPVTILSPSEFLIFYKGQVFSEI